MRGSWQKITTLFNLAANAAFNMGKLFRHLARMEPQFKEEYSKLCKKVQDFSAGLVDHARTSYELEVLLNHNPDGEPWEIGKVLLI